MGSRLHTIRGIEVALPITDGALYRDAFHGTSISRARTIEEGGFALGRGWYGPGVYFWLGDLEAAIWFARVVRSFGTTWAVVKAIVDSGQTLNVDQLWRNRDIERAAVDSQWEMFREKDWTNSDVRSCIAWLCLKACEEAGITIHSVVYFEFLQVFQRQVRALCVKSPESIKSLRHLAREEIPWRLSEDEP